MNLNKISTHSKNRQLKAKKEGSKGKEREKRGKLHTEREFELIISNSPSHFISRKETNRARKQTRPEPRTAPPSGGEVEEEGVGKSLWL